MRLKKYLLGVVIFLLSISCKKDYEKITITDFTKPKRITLEPYSFKPYAMFRLRIKGFANDTIRIKTEGVYNLDFKLTGKIDTLWQSDYYGETSMKCTFLPYKASSGELELEVNL